MLDADDLRAVLLAVARFDDFSEDMADDGPSDQADLLQRSRGTGLASCGRLIPIRVVSGHQPGYLTCLEQSHRRTSSPCWINNAAT